MTYRARVLLAALAAALTGALPHATPALGAPPHRAVVELDGTLRAVHSDDFAGKRSSVAYELVSDKRVVRLSLRALPDEIEPGMRVHVRGVLTGSTLAVDDDSIESTSGTTTAAATGARKTAVILLNFSTDTRRPWTNDQVRSTVFTGTSSVDAYYREQSFDRTSFTGKLRTDGDVFGWYTISSSPSTCDVNTWSTAANSAAQADGVDLNGYQHIVYAWPTQSSCGWAGMAYVPGSISWINGYMTLGVLAHELGHNLGAHHAGSLSCSDGGTRVTLSSSCTFSEYGDPFDVMGNIASRHMNTWHKAKLGWYDAGRMLDVGANGTYALAPIEPSSTGVQLLRVPRGTTGDYYYVEYRQPFGFDSFLASDPVVNGVSLRLGKGYTSVTQSRLLDMTPSTSSFGDAALAAGKTFADSAYGITFRTISVDSWQASVEISFGSTPPARDTTAPSAPSNLAAQVQAGPAVALSWTASTDNVAVSGYRIYRDGVEIGSSTTTSYTDSSVVAGGSHTYTVKAIDGAGNLSTASSSVTVTVGSPTFADVSTSHPFYAEIEELYARGITTGCDTTSTGQLLYCPTDHVKRQAMAAFIIRAKGLTQLTPLIPTFADVPATHPFYGYVERFYEQGVTTGCGRNTSGQLLFCPTDNVKRQAMAAFINRAKGLSPLTPATPTFADVPATHAFYGHIERFYAEGITTGCGRNEGGQLLFCPDGLVKRQAMAAFLVRAFPAPGA